MDFASHQKKEKDVWLAMRFGCCASREDAVEREVLQGNGTSDFTTPHCLAYFASFFRILLSLLLFRSQCPESGVLFQFHAPTLSLIWLKSQYAPTNTQYSGTTYQTPQTMLTVFTRKL